jgi:hypothetical protein
MQVNKNYYTNSFKTSNIGIQLEIIFPDFPTSEEIRTKTKNKIITQQFIVKNVKR